jgi:hypothetical protein
MAFTPRIEINGAIDTAQSVLSNINKIAASTQTYVTWDPSLGKFTTVLNRAGSSVYTFDDSNIIGSITISGTGIDGVYNSARIGFTSKDQRGKKDERVIIIPQEDRFAQELDNQLSMDFDLITDPVQAELLGAIELKQTRVDMAIEFATDYRAIGLRAGEIIGINNELYFDRSSANPKLFRIISIEEIDGEDGGILLSITALEYDSNVYSTSGLTREERILESGITPAIENVCIIEKENIANGKKVGAALQTDEGRAAITGAGVPIFQTISSSETGANIESMLESAYTANALYFDETAYPDPLTYPYYFGFSWNTLSPIKQMQVAFDGPQGTMNYDVDGASKQITAGIPLKLDLYYSYGGSGYQWVGKRFMEWSTYISTMTVVDIPISPVSWLLLCTPLNTYDLNASNNFVKPTSLNGANTGIITDASGDAAGVTITLFQN